MDMQEKEVDVFIAGGGAAGLTAAMYSSRAGMKTVLCDTAAAGGLLASIDKIENFPSYTEVSGIYLADKMKEQAILSGAEINEFSEVTEVIFTDNKKMITADNISYTAKSVIVATGSSIIPLDVHDEKKFRGHGIHYCAVCDGTMYKNKTVAVVGGGNSAVTAGIYLSGIASKVLMIRRYDSFHCEKILLDRLKAIDNIQILYNWNIVDVVGDGRVIAVVLKNMKNNTQSVIPADAVFAYTGYRPNTELFKEYITVDENGYILTDDKLMTNIFGVYAAGDVRSKGCRQITTAVSDGTIAASNAQKTVNKILQ